MAISAAGLFLPLSCEGVDLGVGGWGMGGSTLLAADEPDELDEPVTGDTECDTLGLTLRFITLTLRLSSGLNL